MTIGSSPSPSMKKNHHGQFSPGEGKLILIRGRIRQNRGILLGLQAEALYLENLSGTKSADSMKYMPLPTGRISILAIVHGRRVTK